MRQICARDVDVITRCSDRRLIIDMSLHSRHYAKRSNSQHTLKATSVDTLDDVLVLIKNAGYTVDDVSNMQTHG